MRRWAAFLVCLVAALSTGCHTHQFLRRNVNKQTATLTDILYTQVLDNVALEIEQPGALPHFAVIGDGTTQTTDSGSGEASLVWNPFGLTSESARGSGSRSLQENWKLQPVMSAGRLQRMLCAYKIMLEGATWRKEQATMVEQDRLGSTCAEHIVFEGDTCCHCLMEMVRMQWLPAPEGYNGTRENDRIVFCSGISAERYEQALLERLHCNFPQGWYHVSCDCDPPECALYKGKSGKVRVWVDADGLESLSRFTMTVLQLATNDPPTLGKRLLVTRRYLDMKEGALTEVSGEVGGEIESYRFPALTKPLDDAARRLGRVEQTLFDNCGEEAGDCHIEIHELADELATERARILATDMSMAQKVCALDCLGEHIRGKLELILPRVRDRQIKENLEQIKKIERAAPPPQNPLDRSGNSPFSRGGGGIEVGGGGAGP